MYGAYTLLSCLCLVAFVWVTRLKPHELFVDFHNVLWPKTPPYV